jgi:NIPSNAP
VIKNSWKYNIAVIAMGFIMIGHQTGQPKQRYPYASNSQLAMKTKVTKSTNAHSKESTVLQKVQTCCSVLELRQYTLHPGRRDVLIELFDREFIESQEALGMTLVGQFRDLDDPNRFVWLRGFADMPSRARALEGFYGGPIWKAHREAANATMIDSDNVLLLRPARPGSEFQIRNDRPPVGTKGTGKGLIVATIYYFDAPVTDDFVGFFENAMKPALSESGASVLACFVTEHTKNNFPRLPVREGENVFVWFSSFRDVTAYAEYMVALSRSQRWLGEVTQKLAQWLKRNPEVLKLSPTERSRLRRSG